jgi:hypothetical protein
MMRGDPGRSSVSPSAKVTTLPHRPGAETPVPRAVPNEPQQRSHLDGAPAGVGLTHLTASPGRIELVDAYRDAVFPA